MRLVIFNFILFSSVALAQSPPVAPTAASAGPTGATQSEDGLAWLKRQFASGPPLESKDFYPHSCANLSNEQKSELSYRMKLSDLPDSLGAFQGEYRKTVDLTLNDPNPPQIYHLQGEAKIDKDSPSYKPPQFYDIMYLLRYEQELKTVEARFYKLLNTVGNTREGAFINTPADVERFLSNNELGREFNRTNLALKNNKTVDRLLDNLNQEKFPLHLHP
jgi:hypothetical protein